MDQLLALDCSTHSTGYAIFEGGRLVTYGCLQPSAAASIERILTICKEIDKILNQYPNINKIIMEEVLPKNDAYDDNSSHHANPKVFKPLMWLQGAINILIYLKHKKIKVEFIMPSSWRSKCGIKTGRGIHRETLKASDIKFAKDKFNIDVNDDIADAIGIGWAQIKDTFQDSYDWT